MVTTVGNLSVKGVAFYKDETLKQEIPQNAILNVSKNREVEFYIGIRHRLDSKGRMGRILALEENYRTFFIDMIQEIDGNYFRNFDNIESFSVETTFDAYGFLKNILLEKMNAQLYEILAFLSIPHMGAGDAKKIFEKCFKEPERDRFISCKGIQGKPPPFRLPPPLGFWERGKWPPKKYYNFMTDFFTDPKERDKVSIWDQYITSPYVHKAYIHQFTEFGFNYKNRNYNYLNNIRPEQTELLNYRWRRGGYDVTVEEYRVKRADIHNRFAQWYRGSSIGNNRSVPFHADERTVKGFTGIGQVELRPVFERDEHILIDLLGPRHCVARDEHGRCLMEGYGDEWGASPEIKQEKLYNLNNPDGTIPLAKESENLFLVLYAPTMESATNEYIQSSSVYNILTDNGPNAIEALYAIDNNFGMMGGQTIFDNGTGTEYRYFMTFASFLEEQGWTLEDFMLKYEDLINDRIVELKKALEVMSEPVRVKDYSEFYDKDRKAPFDGIYHYVPIPVSVGGGVTVEKQKVSVDQDGVETISNIPGNSLGTSDFKLPIDKDEFVSKVSVDGTRMLISTFMKSKVNIVFKEGFLNVDKTKIRMFTTDFTYMNEREFRVR